MTEPGVFYRAATEGLEPPGRAGVLEITEIDNLARYVLRAGDAIIAGVSTALDLMLDQAINRAVTEDRCTALRLGPDEWLLLTDAEEAKNIARQIGAAADGGAYALVDVSHRNIGFSLKGSAVVDALVAGCPQALGITRFPVGKCSRTIFAKAEIVLWRRAEHEFHLETGRSFAPYVMEYVARETVLL